MIISSYNTSKINRKPSYKCLFFFHTSFCPQKICLLHLKIYKPKNYTDKVSVRNIYEQKKNSELYKLSQYSDQVVKNTIKRKNFFLENVNKQ